MCILRRYRLFLNFDFFLFNIRYSLMFLDVERLWYFKLNISFLNWIFVSLNFLYSDLIFFQWYNKNKRCSNLPFWLTYNVSSKLLSDYLTYMQSKTNTICIYFTCLFQKSEKLKQLFLIFLLYSNARILNNNLNNTMLCILYDFNKILLFWVW